MSLARFAFQACYSNHLGDLPLRSGQPNAREWIAEPRIGSDLLVPQSHKRDIGNGQPPKLWPPTARR
jgi:hypothetical protein